MKTVYSAPNIALVSLLGNILEGRGIKCCIKNECLTGSIGYLSACWPQLCVDDDTFSDASRIVEEALSPETDTTENWKCRSCGEDSEGQFTECWNCGKSRFE